MPPKKISDKNTSTPKSAKGKTPRPKKAKEKVQKPKLKTPTVLKMKMPSIKNALSLKKTQGNTRNKSTPEPEINPILKSKIDLANEVIRTQLAKPGKKSELLIEDVANTVKKKAVKRKMPATPQGAKNTPKNTTGPKKTVNKKTQIKRTKVTDPETEKPDTNETPKRAKNTPKNTTGPKKTVNKKTQIKRTKVTDPQTEKPDTNETPKKQQKVMDTPPIPTKRKYVRKKLVVTDSDITDAGSTPESKILRRKGKREVINGLPAAGHLQCPSLLDEPKNILKTVVADVTEKHAQIEGKTEPTHVDSRKTSTSECLSWTREISSSNTTISCLSVHSHDIVKINKKLPVVILSKELADAKRDENEKCESSSSESDSESSSGSSSSLTSSRSTASKSLELSSSSATTPTKSHTSQNSGIKSKTENAMAKITQKLKQFESHKFLGIDNKFAHSAPDDIFNNKIFKLVKEENEIINCCRKIEDFFKASDLDCFNNFNTPVLNAGECSRGNSPKIYSDKSEEDDNFTSSKSKFVMLEQNCTEENPLQTAKAYIESSEDDNFTSDKVKYTTFEGSHNDDDDDALSLFAESITGIESSRVESSANSICPLLSDVEEYVPQPKTNLKLITSPKYVPTKINDISNSDPNYHKEFRENNNLDSATPHKNKGNRVNNNADEIKTSRSSSHTFNLVPVPTSTPQVAKTNLSMSNHRPLAGVKSTVFRGVCFYNLISKCMKMRCMYPHIQPDPSEIQNKITKLSTEFFLQEYLLLRGWPDLRRKYGVLYVLECINRKLTRVLLEMVIDFIAKVKLDHVEDETNKIYIVEKTLLYLNDTDLSDFVDLLKFDFGKGLFLCDVFMQIIADTQNFTRFKTIFVKLTNLNASFGRRFSLDVASKILERVYILPFEEQLVRALLKILENTDAKIFKNPIIPKFEAVIASSIIDQAIYEEFSLLKGRALGKDARSNDADTAAGFIKAGDGIQNAERVTEEQPEIHQKVIRLNHVFKPSNVPRQSSVEKFRPPVKKRSWPSSRGNYQALVRNLGMRFPMSMHRHSWTPPRLKKRDDHRQAYNAKSRLGDSFGKFPRLPAPDFF